MTLGHKLTQQVFQRDDYVRRCIHRFEIEVRQQNAVFNYFVR